MVFSYEVASLFSIEDDCAMSLLKLNPISRVVIRSGRLCAFFRDTLYFLGSSCYHSSRLTLELGDDIYIIVTWSWAVIVSVCLIVLAGYYAYRTSALKAGVVIGCWAWRLCTLNALLVVPPLLPRNWNSWGST